MLIVPLLDIVVTKICAEIRADSLLQGFAALAASDESRVGNCGCSLIWLSRAPTGPHAAWI